METSLHTQLRSLGAYQLLFNRPPSNDERDTGLAFLTQANTEAGWNQYAQALLGSEEFRYIE